MADLQLTIRTENLDKVRDALARLSGPQARQAYANAINDAAFQVRKAMQAELRTRFDRVTPFIANAPQANIASIYFNDGATWFEGPFFVEGQHVQVPGPDAIKEAIYCHAVGATPEEQEQTGRCLPD